MTIRSWRRALPVLALLALLAAPSAAHADRLEVAPDAPLWMHLGAGALLWLHIGGGAAGMLSGAVAIVARKGGRLHRRAGAVFVVAMLTMAAVGGAVAPFLNDRISTVAGFMTFYLVLSGWLAARRRAGVSPLEVAGLFVAIGGVAATALLTWMARQTAEGTLDGSPPQAFYLFLFVSTIAALGDLKLVLRGGIAGAERIARHVWRMCFGFFVSTGSLFLGQMQIFPQWLQDTPVLYILALAPLPFLVFWVAHARLAPRWRVRREAAA
jgi:uncharacterized membrane protein